MGSTSGAFGTLGDARLTVRAPVGYSALYPHIHVRLTSSIWADKLAAGEADIDLRPGYHHWPGYKVEFLFSDAVPPLASPATLSALERPFRAAVLAELPLVHVMGSEDHWVQLFLEEGIQRPPQHADLRVDSSITGAEIAASSRRLAPIQAWPFLIWRKAACCRP